MKNKTNKNQRFSVPRKFIKFSRKSMEVNPMSLVIGATILGIVLFVFIKGVIPIWTGKQIPFLEAKVDETTKDCDGDNILGLSDKCPCSEGTLTDEKQPCPQPDSDAITNCPSLCKQFAESKSASGSRS